MTADGFAGQSIVPVSCGCDGDVCQSDGIVWG